MDGLIDRLLDLGYATKTVREHLREWVEFARAYEDDDRVIPSEVQSREVDDYLDRHCERHKGGDAQVRRQLRVFLEGTTWWDRPSELVSHPKPALYEAFVPPYLDFVRCHRGRRTTHQLEHCLERFFVMLAEDGIYEVCSVTPAHIRGYISSLRCFRRATIATEASALRGFLRYLHQQGQIEAELVYAVEVPQIFQYQRPPMVLEEGTVDQVLTSVDRSTALGKRDYAMLVLAARCGLRPADIRALSFDHIEWRQQRIAFIQSKTQRLLELPLLADVQDALVDYIRDGRPQCAAREIFVRHLAPIRPLAKRNNLWHVMDRALRAAGIEMPGQPSGLYLLRHSLTTRMLKHGVSMDTISGVLGHSSVDATRAYAQVDLVGLRSVAIYEEEVRR
jgi:site-specific recombinase XerD